MLETAQNNKIVVYVSFLTHQHMTGPNVTFGMSFLARNSSSLVFAHFQYELMGKAIDAKKYS